MLKNSEYDGLCVKIHYNSNFRADSNNGADSSLESASDPALFFSGIGGSDSGIKMESQQL